jgi:hypothetical protein
MHLIILLIRWLAGLVLGDENVARRAWSCSSPRAGTVWFRRVSSDVHCLAIGRIKVRLMLARFSSQLSCSPARAVVSPDSRGFLRADSRHAHYFVVENARIPTNFSPPAPHCWDYWDLEKAPCRSYGVCPPKTP